jgi:peptidyl-prolyl cis-trans isomerase SurA
MNHGLKPVGRLLLVLLPLLAPAQDNPSRETSTIVEGIAAIVGDNIILKSDLAQLTNMTAIQQRIDPTREPERFARLQEAILQSMIDQKIILEMAELDSLEVKEKDVDRALDQQLENIVSQAGSEERAEALLGQSLKSFRREFWYEMRDRLITEQYQQNLLSSITINREEVLEFFDKYRDSLPPFPTQVRLRHLLIPIEAGEPSRQRAVRLLDSLRQRILAGESFAQLARTYSQDPGTRDRGGDLGFVRRGTLVQEFEAVAFTLSPGELSQPVATNFGYHLIQTLEIQGDKAHIRHILIIPEITWEDESRAYQQALAVKDSAATLEDFIALAKRHSADEKTRDIGGDLGWIDPNNYPIPEITQVLPLLELNTCSLPVKTDLGYHLLWLEAIKPGGPPDLETHWYEIEAMALNQKKMRYYQDWLKKTRGKFFVHIME